MAAEHGRRSAKLLEVRRSDLEERGASGVAELARRRWLVPGKKEKSGEMGSGAQGTKCAKNRSGCKRGMPQS